METCPVCLSAVDAHDLRPGRFGCSHRICASCDGELRARGLLRCPVCRAAETAWRYDAPYYGYLILQAPLHLQDLVGLHRVPWSVFEYRLGFRPGTAPRPPHLPGVTFAHVYSMHDAYVLTGFLPTDRSQLTQPEQALAMAAEEEYFGLEATFLDLAALCSPY